MAMRTIPSSFGFNAWPGYRCGINRILHEKLYNYFKCCTHWWKTSISNFFYDFTFTSVKTTNHLAHDLICCYKSQNVKNRKKNNKLSRKVPTIFTNLFSVDDTIGWNGVTNFQLLYWCSGKNKENVTYSFTSEKSSFLTWYNIDEEHKSHYKSMRT